MLIDTKAPRFSRKKGAENHDLRDYCVSLTLKPQSDAEAVALARLYRHLIRQFAHGEGSGSLADLTAMLDAVGAEK